MVREFHRRDLVFVASSFTGYLLLQLLFDGEFTIEPLEITLPVSAGLAVPLGVAFGIPGVAGLATGGILSDLLAGSLSTTAIFYTASVIFLSYLSLYAYGAMGNTGRGGSILRTIGQFTFVAVVACSGAGAFLALAYQMAGITPFYITVFYTFLQFLVATAVVAPVVALLLFVGERFSGYRLSRTSDFGSPARIDRWSLVAVGPLWVLLGSIGSVGFKLRERVSLGGFQNFDVEFLYYLVHPDIFGQGGRRAQVVFGVVALLVIFHSTRRMGRRNGGVR